MGADDKLEIVSECWVEPVQRNGGDVYGC